MRTTPAVLLTVAVVVLAGGIIVPPAGREARITHPSGTEIVLRVTTTDARGAAQGRVTVRGDGAVVIQPGLAPDRASPEPLLQHVGEDGVQHRLRTAASAGLLGRPDFGSTHRSDGGTVGVELHAAGHRVVLTVRAGLDPSGDRGLTGPQRRARASLRRFVHQVLDPAFDRPAGTA
jgi:hypothetical protein